MKCCTSAKPRRCGSSRMSLNCIQRRRYEGSATRGMRRVRRGRDSEHDALGRRAAGGAGRMGPAEGWRQRMEMLPDDIANAAEHQAEREPQNAIANRREHVFK